MDNRIPIANVKTFLASIGDSSYDFLERNITIDDYVILFDTGQYR